MTVTFDFTTTTIPVRAPGPGRPAEPNPFLDKVAELVDENGDPRDVAVSFRIDEASDSEVANRIRRQLARAGIVHNVSVFKKIEPDEEDGSVVTFWAQNRIIPQRKPKEVDGTDAATDDDEDDEDALPAPSGSVTLTP